MTIKVKDNFNGSVDIYFGKTFSGTMDAQAFIQECEILVQNFGFIEWM